MTESRNKAIESIIDGINKHYTDIGCKKIFFVTGDFGIGKSWVTAKAEEELISSDSADAVFRFEQVREMGYLPEFLNNAILSFRASLSENDVFSGNETSYNMTRYLELLNLLKTKSPELFEDVLTSFVLKSDADIFISEKFSQNELIKDKIASEIIELIEQKGDQRLLLETPKVVAESFIVDFMTYFFSSEDDTTAFKHALSGTKRKKIVFIIDNYEHISGSINDWLVNEFFHYCFNKTFSEFLAYNITHIPSHLKISDFFDFRFIITGRKEHPIPNELHQFNSFRHLAEYVSLKALEISELSEFVSSSGYNYENIENLHTISYGIPYIILLWLEYFSRGGIEADKSLVYLKVSESLLRYSSEEHKEWILCAAFLNDFDQNGLRCFPIIGDSYQKAFSFFENATDFVNQAKNNLKMLEIKPFIKEFIKETVSLETFDTAKEYLTVSRNYNDIKDIFAGLTVEDVNVVRNLAYFTNIDETYGLEQAFQTDTERAKGFIRKFPGWFDKKTRCIQIKPDIADKLKKFNKMVDMGKLQDKIILIGGIWERQQKRLQTEILDCQASLPELNQEIIILEKENNSHKSVYEGYQKEFIEKENYLIEIRKQLSAFSSRHTFISSGMNFGAAMLVFIISVIFPDFFGKPDNQDSVEIVQYIMRFLAIVFGIIGCIYSIKAGMIFSKKKELNELKKLIRDNENERQEIQDKMKEIRDKKDLAQKRVIEIYEKLKDINNKIKDNQEKLLEPYI